MSFKTGQIVEAEDYPGALWEITKLGEQDFYVSGQRLSEECSTLSLYQPPLDELWIDYPKTAYCFRNEMSPAPPLVVIAKAATRKTTAVANLRRRWRRRHRR